MLTAFYDLKTSPPTYDFLPFLLDAENLRIEKGFDSIRMVFVRGPNGGFRMDQLWPYGPDAKREIFEKLAKPMASLLPSVREIHEINRRQAPEFQDGEHFGLEARHYSYLLFSACMKKGIRPLRAPITRKGHVTITLREAEHWPERNSNLPEWLKFAEEISKERDVVFLRDTYKAGEDLPFECDHEASADIKKRASLYAGAHMNLGVGNGPMWLSAALDAPTLVIRPYGGRITETQLNRVGLWRGQGFPGRPKHMDICWDLDRAEKIIGAYRRLGA